MADIFKYLSDLLAACGPLWSIAVAGAFIAGAGEKSYPNEAGKHPAALALTAGIVSLVTPFLLFLHAFWAIAPQTSGASFDLLGFTLSVISTGVAMVLLAVMAVLIVAPPLLGIIVARIAPPLGKGLYAVAPMLHLAVFALTVYATHDNVLAVINAALQRPL